ncbi:MAG: leucine-rich repeat domain-containing protein [Bacteroidaceae bacterium]|nr:leucine-rich repeat domain-containing protein [Bacteroidaceae bacterium]
MKKSILLLVSVLLILTGCKTTKVTKANPGEVWQTMMVKQVSSEINDGIITAKYSNGTTLYYRILDNFGNVSLTWDRSNGRTSYETQSNYKGDIEIPSFVTVGENDEFVFRVMEIDQHAFCHSTSLRSISIPYSVLRINIDAFSECIELERITVNPNNQTYKDVEGVLYSKDSRMIINYPAKKKDKVYILPEEVSFICTEAFKDNHDLEVVKIGDNVTALSDYAFKNCTNLKTVALGSNVRIIGKEAFANCPNLKEIFSANVFPPHNSPKVFDSTIYDKCVVYVPTGSSFHYRRTLEWQDFKNMEEREHRLFKVMFGGEY